MTDPVQQRLDQLEQVKRPESKGVNDPARFSTGTKIAFLVDFSDLLHEQSTDMKDYGPREYYTVVSKIKSRVLKSPILDRQGTVYQLDHLGLKPWNHYEDHEGVWHEFKRNVELGPGIQRVFTNKCPENTRTNTCPFDSAHQRPLVYWLTVDEDGQRASIIFTSSVVDLQQLHDDLTNDVNPGIIHSEYPVLTLTTMERPTVVRRSKPRVKFNVD